MSVKKFLVPVSAAVATLGAADGHAAVPQTVNVAPQKAETNIPVNTDPIVQHLTYQRSSENHMLLMRKSAEGEMYAYHGSHASHASHASHRSGG